MKVMQFNTNTTFKKYSVRAMSGSVRERGGGRGRNMPYGLAKGPRDASRNKKGKKRRRLVE